MLTALGGVDTTRTVFETDPAMSSFINGEDLGANAAPVKLAWSEYWQDPTALAMGVLGPVAILSTEHRPSGADGPDLSGSPTTRDPGPGRG
jgi:hypothetical protein